MEIGAGVLGRLPESACRSRPFLVLCDPEFCGERPVGYEKCVVYDVGTEVISETVQTTARLVENTNKKSHSANRMVLSAGPYGYG